MSIGISWAPAYETLYRGEKRGLSHAARGVFVGLCIEAKKANCRGVVALPRGETDAVAGIRELIGGRFDEVDGALKELLAEPDPMVRIDGRPGRLTCRVLSWSPKWVLGEAPRESAEDHPRDDECAFNLRSWRKANGATQDDVARLLGLSRSRVADVEARRRDLREEEVAKLVAYRRSSGGPDIVPDNVTHLSDAKPDIAPTSSPTLLRHCSDIQPDTSADIGGVRGGVSGVYTKDIREEKMRGEESESRARSSDIAPTSSPTLLRHCSDIQPDTSADIGICTTPDTSAFASADDLLTWVSTARCLRALTVDSTRAREWAEDAAAGLAMAGARADDVRAAISAFVTQRGNAVRERGREAIVEELGRYLKNAKRYGDVDRARADRKSGGAHRDVAADPEPDEMREAKRRVIPGRQPPPPARLARGSA